MIIRDGNIPVTRWFDPEYWLSLNPSCSISKKGEVFSPIELPEQQIADLRQRMDSDGYFDVASSALNDYEGYSTVIARLGNAIRELVRCSHPFTQSSLKRQSPCSNPNSTLTIT